MPGRDADLLLLSSREQIGRPSARPPNPRAPGTDRREAWYPVPALHVQTGPALAYLAAAVLSWALALVVGVLAALHVFPGR